MTLNSKFIIYFLKSLIIYQKVKPMAQFGFNIDYAVVNYVFSIIFEQ
ncbi:MAG: hypothetical protein BAJALOKI2v1_110053 [Promethearchaeota archaeon]|nr:MAG: hypothetical protein BAJALOKI2v1_110053 [Candidatus Lokiarchaeota archaeon]